MILVGLIVLGGTYWWGFSAGAAAVASKTTVREKELERLVKELEQDNIALGRELDALEAA